MGLEFGVKVGNMARDNGLYVCVVKPHGVSDKPLGEAILHGSGGRRMTADILCFDEGSSGGVFEEHFTMTAVSRPKPHAGVRVNRDMGPCKGQAVSSNTAESKHTRVFFSRNYAVDRAHIKNGICADTHRNCDLTGSPRPAI